MKRTWIVAAAAALLTLALSGCTNKRNPKQAPLPPDLTPHPASPERTPASGARRAAAGSLLRCPDCKTATLTIDQTLRLRPDGHSDDLALQSITCSRCGKRGVATYQEIRRGRGDRHQHQGGWLSRGDHEIFRQRIGRCPAPDNMACLCEAHERYYQLKEDRWKGLRMFSIIGEPFSLQRR